MQAAFDEPVTVLLLGPPGSGKGTQAERLSITLGVPAISTGDMLRAECASGSGLGRSVRAFIDSGRLVNDELTNKVVASRLDRPDCKDGFILDGYPRTVPQARFLQALLRSMSMPEPSVVHLDVDIDEVQSRLARRMQCPTCGRVESIDAAACAVAPVCVSDGSHLLRRVDDCEAGSVAQRVHAYECSISSLVAFYRNGDYHRIQATGRIPDITREILDRIASRNLSSVKQPEFSTRGGMRRNSSSCNSVPKPTLPAGGPLHSPTVMDAA